MKTSLLEVSGYMDVLNCSSVLHLGLIYERLIGPDAFSFCA